jgi:similar to stage IV sporulation protein
VLVIKIWNYFRGYVVFKLEGLNLERVLNLAVEKDIYLWDIRRISYTTIEGKVGIKGYKELLRILKKTGCRSKIQLKVGYPFFIFKLKRKKIVAVGLIICILLIVSLTSFIWDIEVEGNVYVSKQDILTSLENMGVKVGVFKYYLSSDDIKDNLLINHDELAWVGVEIKGTKIRVEVVEKYEEPVKIDKSIPCDIIAKKNGVIEKIIAKNGVPLVKKGDIVKQNQLLISGKIKEDGGLIRLVHSLGEIYARTFYEKTKKMPIYRVTKIKTGRKFTRRILKFGESTFMFSKGKVPFDKYVVETKNKSLIKWRKINVPVEIVIEEYFEVIEKKKKVPENVLKKALKDFLLVNLIKEIPEEAKIVNKTTNYKIDGNMMWANLTIEALESIGIEKGFDVNELDIDEEE